MPINTKYPNLPNDFLARIRETRLIRGITQRQIGDDLGIGFPQVSQYERGKRNFNYEMAVKFRDYLEMDYDLPLPRPEEAPFIVRKRRKSDLEHGCFFITIDDELIEVVTYRRFGKVTPAKLIAVEKLA